MTREPVARPDERRAVFAFGVTSFFSDLAHEAVTAVLPLLVLMLGGAPALALGLIEGVSDALSAFCKLAGGQLADRLRRLKPATIAGYAATGVAMPAIGLAAAWWHVLLLRTLAWCGRGFRSPIRDALFTRSVPAARRGRAIGVERAMDQAGAVAAPLLVILLLREGVSVPNVVLLSIIPGLLAVLTLLALVREEPRAPARAREPGVPDLGTLPGSFRRLLVALLVFGSGDFAKTLLVLWALGENARITESAALTGAILLYAGFNAVTIVSALFGGRLSDRFGRRRVLVVGYAAGVAAAAVPVFLDPSFAAGAVALAFAGVVVGIEESVERAWAADLAPEGRRGRAFGWIHATNGVGDMIASGLVGGIWALAGPSVAFGAAAGLMAAGTLLITRVR
jgi:MFS family permease